MKIELVHVLLVGGAVRCLAQMGCGVFGRSVTEVSPCFSLYLWLTGGVDCFGRKVHRPFRDAAVPFAVAAEHLIGHLFRMGAVL